jgi:hypothetical protein
MTKYFAIFQVVDTKNTSPVYKWFADTLGGYRVESIIKSAEDLYVIFLISVPLSLLLYLVFSKYRHWVLVDLGFHKWLIK